METKFGVVQFEEARPDSRGWASVDGEKATLVRGTGDLASDVLWWTNLDYDAFVKSGCVQNFKLRRSDYMRANMDQIANDLGLVEAIMNRAKSTEILSEIFSRTMHLAVSQYGIKFGGSTLAADLRMALGGEDKALGFGIDQASECAYQTYHRCERNPRQRGFRIVNFRRPRVNHAEDILSAPMPTRQWEFLSKDDITKVARSPAKVVDWILKQGRPALVQAAITETAPSMASIVAFGGGARGDRSWISHPELLLLSRFCKINIKTAFLSSGYEPFAAKIPMRGAEGLNSLSVSQGLLAENYWVAIASPQPPQMGDKIHTPLNVWMRAVDRVSCFMPAMIVHQAGLSVSMYGIGAVSMAVPAGNMDRAIEVAAEAGLMPPLSVREDMKIQQDLS